ncbi:MAG: hypothetical protein [Microviridae sp.]|nr:MAG: hypothetical protein [Microviridae sp.]
MARLKHNFLLEEQKDFTQDFIGCELVTDYKYDEVTGELIELPTKRDVQAEIDSFASTALENVFDRFMPIKDLPPEEQAVEYRQRIIDDLELLAQASQVAEDYKEQMGLDSKLSISEVYKQVFLKSEELAKDIKAKAETKAPEKEKEKEVIPNEKA